MVIVILWPNVPHLLIVAPLNSDPSKLHLNTGSPMPPCGEVRVHGWEPVLRSRLRALGVVPE